MTRCKRLMGFKRGALSIVCLGLAACASIPSGPSVMVLPGTNKDFDQFRGDDVVCRQYASFQVGGQTPNKAGISSGVASAAVGTALGAAAGAAIGGGQGAAIGAGTGLAGGGLVGSSSAASSGYEIQSRYDVAYIQCMYAKGHKVPVSGQFTSSDRPDSRSAPPLPPRSAPDPAAPKY